jgi:hypothetical protein
MHTRGLAKSKPTSEDMARHPLMHRTDTIDIIFVFSGEIYLITDEEEMLYKPGDCIVIRGTNHAWSLRGNEPCMMMGVMLDALPLAPPTLIGKQRLSQGTRWNSAALWPCTGGVGIGDRSDRLRNAHG